MKIYRTPAQARSLREIEAAGLAPTINEIPEVDGNIQPVHIEENPAPEEAWPETEGEAKEAPKKARAKKVTKEV